MQNQQLRTAFFSKGGVCQQTLTRGVVPVIGMDYHDLKTFELEQSAERHLDRAKMALDQGEKAAVKEIERWSNTLAAIRHMKASLAHERERLSSDDRGR